MLLSTVGKNVVEFEIDDEDYPAVIGIRWGASNISGKWYVRNAIRRSGKTIVTYLHRYIASAPVGKCIDHINLNTLDNRKINLRVCTRGENCRNSGMRKNNTSGVKGVRVTKEGNYQAAVMFERRSICLGTYADKNDAIQARKLGVLKYHKEFARY
jgi:hypothetical protein